MKVSNRLQKLRQKLAEKEIDGIFISQPENRYYLSGFDGSAGYLLITPQDTVLATDFRYTEQAGIQSPEYRILQITGSSLNWFVELVAELKIKRLGFESGNISFAFHRKLSEVMNKVQPEIELIPIEGVVESIRQLKEPEEIALITKAAEISDKAMEYIRQTIHVGMTEKEVAWEIEKFMREKGSQSLPFEAIVASGPNAALPHHRPSERRIGHGEPVVIDIGARAGGYCSDLTRTICLGHDSQFNQVYDTVLKAQLAAISTIHEGTSGAEADGSARAVITDAGFGQAFGHSLGHGVGLNEHEQPRLGPNSADTLISGMVFTIEPGIYLTGWGGVRIEDLVLLENGKLKLLSKAGK